MNGSKVDIVGEKDLIKAVENFGGTPQSTIDNAVAQMWGGKTDNLIKLLAATTDGNTTLDAVKDAQIGQEPNPQPTDGAILVGGGGNNVLSAGPGNDLLEGGAGNDTLIAGSGSDLMFGGSGDDTFQMYNSQGGLKGNHWLDGGTGTDTADYSKSADALTVTIAAANGYSVPNNPFSDHIVKVADAGTSGNDQLMSVEKINLGSGANTVNVFNTVNVGSVRGMVPDSDPVTVDLGGKADGPTDTVDFSQYGKEVFLGPGANGAIELFLTPNYSITTNYSFKNFTRLRLSPDNSDDVTLTGPGAAALQELDAGNGSNVRIDSDVKNLKVNLGSGTYKIKHLGEGSIVNESSGIGKAGNAGKLTQVISDDILITGATATNTVITTADGHVEHGAVGSLNSESGWIVGPDGVRYGLDTQGDLEIKNALGDITTVTDYQGGYNVGLSQQTAGIFVGRASVNAYRLLEPKPDTPFNNIGTTFEMGRALWFTESGFGGNQGSSGGTGGSSGGSGDSSGGSSGGSGDSSGGTGGPSGGTGGSSGGTQGGSSGGPQGAQDAAAGVLVLDLDGSGIRLTAKSGAAPMFDMFGTGFAVHTGWVQPSTGLLVIQNADGSVSNIHNLVGGDGNAGFAALAQYDANGDGVIDANDPIYSQLRVWQDSNGNGSVNSGELMTLAQAGIASITIASTPQSGDTIAGNQITATGTFTRADGTTGTIADASFATDAFESHYRGNTTVSAAAAALPNLKGYGTLTDLQIAATLDPALIGTVNVSLSN